MSSVASDSDYQTISETGRQRPPWAVPLSKEALFRIQLSLSSRRSSVMVLETVSRMFIGTLPETKAAMRMEDIDPSDTKWTYQTTGVPGLLVEYHDVKDMTIFSLKLVVVELESGLCTWEGKFGVSANYQVFAEDFHTFWMPELGQVGMEFGDVSEAERMRVLLREWLERLKTSFSLQAQLEADNQSKKRKKKGPLERMDSQPRLDKKQISTPCNFIHVSGITMTRTEECEKELQGTVRRFFRGAISGITRTNTLSLGSKVRVKTSKLSAASSEGNLSENDVSRKLSLPNGGYDLQTGPLSLPPESSQSGKDKKYFSLPRKKNPQADTSTPPDTSHTSDPSPKTSQSDVSLHSSLSSTNTDNITPNSRRKQNLQSRVITGSEDRAREQELMDLSQRRCSSLSQARHDQRKYSAPNMHNHRRDPSLPPVHPSLWRQHSEIQNPHTDLVYETPPDVLYPLPPPYPSNSGARDMSYPYPNSASYSTPTDPYSAQTQQARFQYPYQTDQLSELPNQLPPPPPPNQSQPPYNHPPRPDTQIPSQAYDPAALLPQNPHMRPSKFGRARMSEKRDLRRLSNSYTSFGHASSQVNV